MNVWLLGLEVTVPVVVLLGVLYIAWMADVLPRKNRPSRPAARRDRAARALAPMG